MTERKAKPLTAKSAENLREVRREPSRMLYLVTEEISPMTQLEVCYRYGASLTEAAMRAIDNVREVYGIRRITFLETERIVRVEFDASRLKEPMIAGLLRGAGLDVKEKLVLA